MVVHLGVHVGAYRQALMVGWGVSSSVRSIVSVYYFNTVRRAVYYVLYVLILIIYNTVFFYYLSLCLRSMVLWKVTGGRF